MQLSKENKLYLQIISDLHKYWTPHAGQLVAGKKLINSDVSTLFIQCGRKWGKTDFAVYLLWRHALLNPGSTCYYITPELSHGREIIWNNNRLLYFGRERDEYGRFLPGGGDSLAKYIKGKPNNVDSRIVLTNKSSIKIVGSENWAAANGLTPDFVVYDEFKVFHRAFHNEMNPNRIVRKAPLVIIGTPPKPGDRNKEQYIEFAQECIERKDAMHIEASSYDNPYIPVEETDREIEKLRLRGEEDVVQREYYGKIVTGGASAIFPMISKEKHIQAHSDIIRDLGRDIKKLEWYCITDPGTTTCFATLIAAIHPYNRQMYILDEVYEKDQQRTSSREIYPRLEKIMMELHKYGDIEEDWIKIYDEAAAWFSTEIMNQFGIYFSPTQKHLNKKENGLSLIKDLLIHDLVVISDRCKNLFWEMENYAKDDKGNIPKKHDHLIDCFRYLMAAANYHMNEIPEIVRKKSDYDRRAYSLKEEAEDWEMERDWTVNLTKNWGIYDD